MGPRARPRPAVRRELGADAALRRLRDHRGDLRRRHRPDGGLPRHARRPRSPFPLRIEHPVDAGSRDGQIGALGAPRRALTTRGSRVQIVVEEWRTLEDIEAFAAAAQPTCCT
ncbi:hypothetical protein [Pseudonocardia sp.]|uniref:hypothetical protein n=1 Tax=Pseudonocardia sp. TaxID=60912 RepID=UPI0031FD2F2C